MVKNTHEFRQDKRNRELCKKIKKNDLDAETRLLAENEGLLKSLTSTSEMVKAMEDAKYGGIELDDILQEGRIAMLRAAQNYDENAGAEFSSYAYASMKNALTDLCRKGLSAFEKRMIDSGLTRVFLDDQPLDKDDVKISDRNSLEWHDPTGNLAVLHVMLEKMRNRIKILPDRERRLIMYRYGLSVIECKSISETAAFFHLTEKYAAEIESKTLKMLKDGMNDGKIV
jgi:RNA polymerase sigma factor (sigma-70 family)